MAVRPLDLQVSINSLIETAREQGSKQATLVQEQRNISGHIVDDSRHGEQMVNQTEKTETAKKLQDTEKHFGTKTEAELEHEFSEEGKQKKSPPEKQPEEKDKKKSADSHRIDVLV